MSRFFPQTVYAEDQPLARTILATHVLHRGFQTGAMAGLTTGTISYLYRLSRSEFQLRAALRSGQLASALRGAVYPSFLQSLYKHAGTGSVAGVAFISVGLYSMMRGRDEIEWQDRSWRLMHNQGQMEVDDWSIAGATFGLVSSVVTGQMSSVRHTVGRMGAGSMLGVVGYLGYRYGIKKGQWDIKPSQTVDLMPASDKI